MPRITACLASNSCSASWIFQANCAAGGHILAVKTQDNPFAVKTLERDWRAVLRGESKAGGLRHGLGRVISGKGGKEHLQLHKMSNANTLAPAQSSQFACDCTQAESSPNQGWISIVSCGFLSFQGLPLPQLVQQPRGFS